MKRPYSYNNTLYNHSNSSYKSILDLNFTSEQRCFLNNQKYNYIKNQQILEKRGSSILNSTQKYKKYIYNHTSKNDKNYQCPKNTMRDQNQNQQTLLQLNQRLSQVCTNQIKTENIQNHKQLKVNLRDCQTQSIQKKKYLTLDKPSKNRTEKNNNIVFQKERLSKNSISLPKNKDNNQNFRWLEKMIQVFKELDQQQPQKQKITKDIKNSHPKNSHYKQLSQNFKRKTIQKKSLSVQIIDNNDKNKNKDSECTQAQTPTPSFQARLNKFKYWKKQSISKMAEKEKQKQKKNENIIKSNKINNKNNSKVKQQIQVQFCGISQRKKPDNAIQQSKKVKVSDFYQKNQKFTETFNPKELSKQINQIDNKQQKVLKSKSKEYLLLDLKDIQSNQNKKKKNLTPQIGKIRKNKSQSLPNSKIQPKLEQSLIHNNIKSEFLSIAQSRNNSVVFTNNPNQVEQNQKIHNQNNLTSISNKYFKGNSTESTLKQAIKVKETNPNFNKEKQYTLKNNQSSQSQSNQKIKNKIYLLIKNPNSINKQMQHQQIKQDQKICKRIQKNYNLNNISSLNNLNNNFLNKNYDKLNNQQNIQKRPKRFNYIQDNLNNNEYKLQEKTYLSKQKSQKIDKIISQPNSTIIKQLFSNTSNSKVSVSIVQERYQFQNNFQEKNDQKKYNKQDSQKRLYKKKQLKQNYPFLRRNYDQCLQKSFSSKKSQKKLNLQNKEVSTFVLSNNYNYQPNEIYKYQDKNTKSTSYFNHLSYQQQQKKINDNHYQNKYSNNGNQNDKRKGILKDSNQYSLLSTSKQIYNYKRQQNINSNQNVITSQQLYKKPMNLNEFIQIAQVQSIQSSSSSAYNNIQNDFQIDKQTQHFHITKKPYINQQQQIGRKQLKQQLFSNNNYYNNSKNLIDLKYQQTQKLFKKNKQNKNAQITLNCINYQNKSLSLEQKIKKHKQLVNNVEKDRQSYREKMMNQIKQIKQKSQKELKKNYVEQ